MDKFTRHDRAEAIRSAAQRGVLTPYGLGDIDDETLGKLCNLPHRPGPELVDALCGDVTRPRCMECGEKHQEVMNLGKPGRVRFGICNGCALKALMALEPEGGGIP